jgi:hypothetical protein
MRSGNKVDWFDGDKYDVNEGLRQRGKTAEDVISIIALFTRGQPPTAADWVRVFYRK